MKEKLKSLLNNFHAIFSYVIWKCSILLHPSKVWERIKCQGVKVPRQITKSDRKVQTLMMNARDSE